MGACGCGDMSIDKAYKLPRGEVVAYDIYRGCRDCFRGPGVSIYAFKGKRTPWLDGVEIEDIAPDEVQTISFGLFEVEDLKAEANELSMQASIGPGRDQYETIADWIDDFGLDLVQGAMRRFRLRVGKPKANYHTKLSPSPPKPPRKVCK